MSDRKRFLLLASDEIGMADEYDTIEEAVEAAELEVSLQRATAEGEWTKTAGCLVVEVRRAWELVERDGGADLEEVLEAGAEARNPAPRWSSTPPATDGWYWWRASGEHVADLKRVRDGRMPWADGELPPGDVGGEWSGPLVPPDGEAQQPMTHGDMTSNPVGAFFDLAGCVCCAVGMALCIDRSLAVAGMLAMISVVNGFFLFRRIGRDR
jgi:hypothetical protein